MTHWTIDTRRARLDHTTADDISDWMHDQEKVEDPDRTRISTFQSSQENITVLDLARSVSEEPPGLTVRASPKMSSLVFRTLRQISSDFVFRDAG